MAYFLLLLYNLVIIFCFFFTIYFTFYLTFISHCSILYICNQLRSLPMKQDYNDWYMDNCHLFEEWEQQLLEQDEDNWELLERDEARYGDIGEDYE